MIPLIKKIIHALLYDELAAKRWLRGLFMWLGGAGVTVAAVGWEVARAWTLKEWAGRLAIAGLLGVGGMITAGQKNLTPEQMRAALQPDPAQPPPVQPPAGGQP